MEKWKMILDPNPDPFEDLIENFLPERLTLIQI